jgi:hypothetical protein
MASFSPNGSVPDAQRMNKAFRNNAIEAAAAWLAVGLLSLARRIGQVKSLTNWRSALCTALVCQFLLPQGFAQQRVPLRLNILVLDGEGASNSLRSVGRQPTLRVEDENHQPVSGAAVVFTLPTDGAGGDFQGEKTQILSTDDQGMVTAHGFRTNQTPGKVVILVTASYRGVSSRVRITQYNASGPEDKSASGGHGKLITILAVIGAAGATGALVGMRQGSSASSSAGAAALPSIGITSGSISVGAPRQ